MAITGVAGASLPWLDVFYTRGCESACSGIAGQAVVEAGATTIGHTMHFDLASFGSNQTLVDCVFEVIEAAENRIGTSHGGLSDGRASALRWSVLGVGIGLGLATAGVAYLRRGVLATSSLARPLADGAKHEEV